MKIILKRWKVKNNYISRKENGKHNGPREWRPITRPQSKLTSFSTKAQFNLQKTKQFFSLKEQRLRNSVIMFLNFDDTSIKIQPLFV